MVRIRPSTVAVSAASIPRPAKKCHETKTELEFGESLAAHRRAILLICFLYDNPAFQVQPSRHDATVKAQVSRAIKQGVEIWQVNFHLDQTGVRVLGHHELTQQFSV